MLTLAPTRRSRNSALAPAFVGIRRLGVEQVVHTGNARCTDTRLIEAAAAEAAAVTDIQRGIACRLVAQRDFRLPIVPGVRANLPRECNTHERRRYEFRRCLGGVLAIVTVVTQRRRQLQFVREIDVDVAEHRPGEIVLRVGKVGELRIEERQGLPPHLGHLAGAQVEDIARGNETIGRDQIRTRDPAHALRRRRCELQRLAHRIDVEKLMLRLIGAEEIEQHRFRNRQEIELIAGQELVEPVVGGDGRQRAQRPHVIELERRAEHIAFVHTSVVHAHRQARVVHALRDVEVQRLSSNARGIHTHIRAQLFRRFPHESQAPGQVSKRIGVLVQKDIPDIALGIEKGARRDVFERVRDRAAHAAANVDAGPGVGSHRHIALRKHRSAFSC